MNAFTALFIGHLLGDFIFQNDRMQAKSKSSFACTEHLLCYFAAMMPLATHAEIPLWVVLVICIEHWLQDRFALHLKWMKFYGQTPPEKWPVGPLCIDQAMHISFIGILCLCFL